MIPKTFLFLLFLSFQSLLLGKDMKVIAFVQKSDDKYLAYLGGHNSMVNTFVVDSATIYIGKERFLSTVYAWNYHQKFSSSNPILIKQFSGLQLKKEKDIMVNVVLDIFNTKTNRRIAVFDDKNKYAPDYNYNIRYSIEDSTIYYFWRSGDMLRSLKFFKYDIKIKKKQQLNLSNFIRILRKEYGTVNSVLVRGNRLYAIIAEYSGTDAQKNKILCWDIKLDRQISQFEIQYTFINERILGSDIWDNLYILSGDSNYEYPLLILSPQLEIVTKIDINKLVKQLSFMKANDYLDSYHGGDLLIVGSFNDHKELFLMVKTIKGLYFLKFDYLSLLSKYFQSKTIEELRTLRNIVFARHGRSFMNQDLQEYFSKQFWYQKNPNYNDNMLTEFDKKSVQFILDLEKEKKK